jgi:hypothetical protein
MSSYTVATHVQELHLGGNILEGDPDCYCPNVWDYVIKRLGIKSVMDLGGGAGHASHYFYRQGIPVVSVDGLKENIEKSIYPSILHDLTKGPVVTKVDLVHCHEVVEHIEEVYLDNLLQSLACGKYILMTNALPGQGGYHHVNEKPTQYWIDHLARYNCIVLPKDTDRVRNLAKYDGAGYMERTGLLLVNKNFK